MGEPYWRSVNLYFTQWHLIEQDQGLMTEYAAISVISRFRDVFRLMFWTDVTNGSYWYKEHQCTIVHLNPSSIQAILQSTQYWGVPFFTMAICGIIFVSVSWPFAIYKNIHGDINGRVVCHTATQQWRRKEGMAHFVTQKEIKLFTASFI